MWSIKSGSSRCTRAGSKLRVTKRVDAGHTSVFAASGVTATCKALLDSCRHGALLPALQRLRQPCMFSKRLNSAGSLLLLRMPSSRVRWA